jgi:RimJ/RimL family protein N-acetyltransferase
MTPAVTPDTNQWGLPVGDPVPGWRPRPAPVAVTMTGRHCRLEALDPPRHFEELHRAYSTDDGRMWTYLPYGPFATGEEYRGLAERLVADESLVPFAIIEMGSGRAVGVATYLRADPANGSVEVGHIAFSPSLKRTVAATEAMALMMSHVFDELGYRRYEWKCDALNAPSRRAATRLGFTYEGTFHQATVVRGRNRDTAWFSITDGEWPQCRVAFDTWLGPDNFDGDGSQRLSLSELTAQIGTERHR